MFLDHKCYLFFIALTTIYSLNVCVKYILLLEVFTHRVLYVQLVIQIINIQ